MKKASLVGIAVLAITCLHAQIDAGLFRFPDVSKTHIVFTYANDIWVVSKEGGHAVQLSSPAGVESFPKFSPDGGTIAFSGNYDGNTDVYKIPVAGGVPFRVTYHGMADRVVDWHPDGNRILFASGRESEKERFNQLYTISASGGAAEKLPLPYGEFASYSPDAKQLAVVFRSEVFRTWKRYRGGDAADIYLFNLENGASENISATVAAGEELPMWVGNGIYYLSDNGPEKRMNLWYYDISAKSKRQITNFTDYDVHFPSLGPEDIVFEAGGKLYLQPLAGGGLKEVNITVVSDKASLKPSLENAQRYIQQAFIARDGNRVLVAARGDIFSLPAEHGYVKNLTQTQGVAERYPSWSPDGKQIAYWSDQSGEYELWIMPADGVGSTRKITSYGPGYRYELYWSPDSRKVAFIDKAMRIKIVDVVTGTTTDVDKGMRMSHGALNGFSADWSSDSRWLTYSRDLENYHQAVFIFDTSTKKATQVTSGYYHASSPVFDSEGKYLYVLTNQAFRPAYSSIDNTFIYPNTTQPAVISLKKSTPSLLAPRNETVAIKKDDTPAPTKTPAKKGKDSKDANEESKPAVAPVEIDFDGLEQRLVLLPSKPGNYYGLGSVKGKVIYVKAPNTGSDPDSRAAVKYYDIEKREEKTIIDNVNGYAISADKKKMLVFSSGKMAVIKPEENQKFDKPLRTEEMEVLVDPVKEWRQLFTDAWRFQRDYFYDQALHGVDWNQVKERYLKMLDDCLTREEVNFVLGEMIGELNASHTYRGGGAEEQPQQKNVGYLGVNYQAEGKHYKIKRIVRAAPWDAEVRSPLDQPGVTIRKGNYLLAVNGIPVTTDMEPFAYFQGLGGKTIELTYNTTASFAGAKTEVVEALTDESRLRHLEWIERNRKRVDEATNGEVGYIYVRSTGVDGQNELIRQFNAQWDKKALVIDERFNNGGQIPDRFIEVLNREPLAFWAIRDGEIWPWPPFAHFGPKVMLINGWSGSGGDAFPDYFRKKNLGPLIGARTWGGLIGISGVPALIDGGSITVPTFRMYNPDGTWFKEGHGVDPDIEVMEDLTSFYKGMDNQLERGIAEIKALLQKNPHNRPARPAAEVR